MFASGTSGFRIHGITVANNYYYNAGEGVNTQFGAVPRFPDNNWFGVRRTSSTNKEFLQNSTINHSASAAGAALNSGRMTRGGGQGGGLMNAKHEGFFIAAASGYTLANVLTALNTLRTALKTP